MKYRVGDVVHVLPEWWPYPVVRSRISYIQPGQPEYQYIISVDEKQFWFAESELETLFEMVTKDTRWLL